MPKPNKKQRHEAKRKAKRQALRRRESVSPVKRLVEAPGEVEYWISDEFESMGQMQVFVYKRAAGLTGMAAFLIDRGVVGLKDTWVRMHLLREEFDEALENSRRSGIAMRRSSADEVRRWVAAALRWAHDNGMRLPKDWARPASFIGGVGDWQSADVSAFVKEFAGHPDDLRQRLVAEPFESYVLREDVRFVFNTDAPYMDQETGEYSDWPQLGDMSEDELEEIAGELPDEEINELTERLSPVVDALTAQTTSWLQARGEAPSGELVEAWRSIVFAHLASKAAMPDKPGDERAELAFDLLDGMSARVEPSRAAEHGHAVEQALKHLRADPTMVQRAAFGQGPGA